MARFKFAGDWKDGQGAVVASGTITIYLAGTTTKATAYDAETGGALSGSVTTTDSSGVFHFWIDDGDYVPTQRFRVIGTKTNFNPLDSEQTDDLVILPVSSSSSTETLTNKTIDTASNTITVVEADISDLGTTVALVADKLDVFAATTSAELASVLSDETGSGGGFMRATSPTTDSPVINTAISGTAFLDEDDMSSDSATKVSSQQSIKKYVDDSVSSITLGTEQASTSGTAIDFTGIPSGTQRIIIMPVGVSKDGTEELLIQLGDAGGVETTGYLCGVSSSAAAAVSTSGFLMQQSGAADQVIHGSIILTLENASAFTWTCTFALGSSTNTDAWSGGGSKSLSAELTTVRITTTGTPDDFDAGVINIQYQ